MPEAKQEAQDNPEPELAVPSEAPTPGGTRGDEPVKARPASPASADVEESPAGEEGRENGESESAWLAGMQREMGREIRTAEDELRAQGKLSEEHWTEAARRLNPLSAAIDRIRDVFAGLVSAFRPPRTRFKMGVGCDTPSTRALLAIAILASIAAVEFPFVIGQILTFRNQLRSKVVAKTESPKRSRRVAEKNPNAVTPPALPHREDPFAPTSRNSGEPAPPPKFIPGADVPAEQSAPDTENEPVAIKVPEVPPVTVSAASAPPPPEEQPKAEGAPVQKLQLVGVMSYGTSEMALLEQDGVVVYAHRGDRVLGGTYRVAEINGDHVKLDQGAGRNDVVLPLKQVPK